MHKTHFYPFLCQLAKNQSKEEGFSLLASRHQRIKFRPHYNFVHTIDKFGFWMIKNAWLFWDTAHLCQEIKETSLYDT